MRMKLNRLSQLLLVSGVSLLTAGLVTACGTLTVDFVYVSSALAAGPNSYGQVDVFEVNSESGKMRQIPTSPFPSGGRNPVAEVAAPDNADLYVVNQDDNTVVQFVIGNDGKLYPQNTVNTPGVFPRAVAVSGPNLYVLDTYQPLPTCSTVAPCSGSVAVFPILTLDQAKALKPAQPVDTLGTVVANGSQNYWTLCLSGYTLSSGTWSCKATESDVIVPTGVTAAASGAYLYVTAYDATAGGGYVFGFAANSDGTLLPMNHGAAPFPVGTHPSAIAADPGGNYVYVTDFAKADVLVYQINAGLLTPVNGSPIASGNGPAAIVVDATGKYVFVVNSQDSNMTAYSASSGTLQSLGTFTTGTLPVAVGIDPSANDHIYTANFLGNSVTGFTLNASKGTLLNSQGSPYASNNEPTAVAAIPHGSVKK